MSGSWSHARRVPSQQAAMGGFNGPIDFNNPAEVAKLNEQMRQTSRMGVSAVMPSGWHETKSTRDRMQEVGMYLGSRNSSAPTQNKPMGFRAPINRTTGTIAPDLLIGPKYTK